MSVRHSVSPAQVVEQLNNLQATCPVLLQRIVFQESMPARRVETGVCVCVCVCACVCMSLYPCVYVSLLLELTLPLSTFIQ